MKWQCKICGCKSDILQDICPNACEDVSINSEDGLAIVRRLHESVNIFFDYYVVDSFDHCMLTAKKEYTELKKAWWEVKEKLLSE